MKKIDRIGEEKTNTFGSLMRITNYRNNKDIDVYFPQYDYTKEHVNYNQFIKGKVKCVYEPKTYGVGYLGEGKYEVSINGKNTKYYDIWCGMLKRAYDPKYIQQHPTYERCEVDKSWLNFQTFSKWVDENYYKIEEQRMELDKDILCKGNKIYSPDTCMFVPHRINTLFIKSDKCRGDLPIGVIRVNKKYNARCNVDKKIKNLGYYNSLEEAFEVYKNFKEQYIKKVAEEYKNMIPSKLYNVMMSYKVEIDD